MTDKKAINALDPENTPAADDLLYLRKGGGSNVDRKVPHGELLNSRGFAQSVDSVEALRDSSFPESLERIWLSGYYGQGTPGGGPLYIDRDDTTSEDNGGTVFVTADGLRAKRPEPDIYTTQMFGIAESDVVTAELQNLFDVAPENARVQIDTTHELDTQILVRKPMQVFGSGRLFCTDFTHPSDSPSNEALIVFAGEQGDEVTTMDGAHDEDEMSVAVLDASGISAGDLIFIESDTKIPHGRDTSFKRQHARVRSVDQNTLHLEERLVYNYGATETVSVYKTEYIEGVVWDGVQVDQQIDETESTQAIQFRFCQNSRIQNTVANEGTRAVIFLRSCYNSHIIDCTPTLTTPADGLQYGALISRSSYCTIKGGVYSSTRAAIDLSESDNCCVSGVTCNGSMNTHTGTNLGFFRCASNSSCHIRSQKSSVHDCTIVDSELRNNVNRGALFTAESARNGGLSVRGCRIVLAHPDETDTYALRITPTGGELNEQAYPSSIVGNTLYAASQEARGVIVGSGQGGERVNDVTFSDNHVTCGVRAITFMRAKNITVSSNTFVLTGQDGPNAFFAFQSTGPAIKNVSFTGNTIDFSGAAGTGRRVLSISGGEDDTTERVILTSNIAENDTDGAVWGGVPAAQYIEANNLFDSEIT